MYSVLHADRRRGISIPLARSNDLAEILGIIAGDGYANSYGDNHLFEITGDASLDKNYLIGYVSPLIKKLFGVSPTIIFRKNQRTMVLRVMSRTIVSFLHDNGIPRGFKDRLRVDEWIKRDGDFSRSYLRGFFDTDGSFRLRNHMYPIISTANKSEQAIIDIAYMLRRVGFRFSTYYKECSRDKRTHKEYVSYRIYLYGKYNFSLWQEQIGFANTRHKAKALDFEKRYGNTGI